MRILFLTRKWPPAVGGMETYAVEMAAELSRLGHEVELRALPGRADGGAPGAGAILGFGAREGLRLLARRGGWDLVFGADMALWPLAALAARGGRSALTLAAHGTDVALAERAGATGALYGRYLRLGARLLAREGVAVAANSGATAAIARRLGFARVAVVPLGCRVRPPEPPPRPGRHLLFAGRLVRRKGLSWFVREVLPRLPEDIRLTVAGTVWDAGEARALEHPRVAFAGPLPQARLWEAMAGALAVVIPNLPLGRGHVEGFGLVAAEAAAAGGIVLAARLEGYESSVIEGETGRLLPPGDAAAWADEIRRLAALPEPARAALGARAARAARARFDWARAARETAALHPAR